MLPGTSPHANGSGSDTIITHLQVLLPVLVILGGVGILQSTLFTGFPDLQFSTAPYNAQGCREPDGGRCLNRMPAFTYKSGTNADSPDIRSWYGVIPSNNVTSMLLTPASSIPDPYGIITSTSSPVREWQSMSAFLLNDANNHAASKYGAIVPTKNGSIVAAQSDSIVPPVSFTIFQNTTSCHVAPTWLNLLDSALLTKVAPGASIATRNHPLPFTEFQAAYVSGNYGFNVAVVIMVRIWFARPALLRRMPSLTTLSCSLE